MYIGRERELRILENLYNKNNSSIIAVYGRRRIGKSSLLHEFCKDKDFFHFEGLENQDTKTQIEHFKESLYKYTKNDIVYSINFKNWTQVFNYLGEQLSKSTNKKIIVFDEFQWMAAGKTKLVSLIKHFCDINWKNLNIQLILCGSIASYMVEKVINSKALYGRIDEEILLSELQPKDIKKFFKKDRNLEEILNYMLVLGGIPKYYEIINRSHSFEKNVSTQFFKKSSYLFNEFEKIFYNQFKEYTTYEQIIIFLSSGPKTLKQISERLKIKSGGGLKRYLTNLLLARFIRASSSIEIKSAKTIKYTIFDEYLNFYFKYIFPKRAIIRKDLPRNIFQTEVKKIWLPWLGLAFEKFCLKYINAIINALEINDVVEDFGPLFQKDADSFQVDLIIKRIDKVWNVCECKLWNKPVGVEVIKDFEKKIALVKKVLPRGFSIEKTLIAPNGIDQSMKKLEYFDSVVTLEDLFRD